MKGCRKYLQFSPMLFMKTLFLEFMVSLVITALREKHFSRMGFAEMSFLIALLFLCIGLFRLTKRLQFYAMLSYGVKKLLQAFHLGNMGEDGKPIGDYPEYLEKHKNNEHWIESVASALLFMIISTIFVYVF